ncbi:chemotaxis protein CheB [Plantactinospora siamensis]|uniref:protein-glutamate methylesterase n=1 Tax=Plantactinospora siamensis TaxID=555372 RepID=A0ABV6NXC2_9ACTN
MESSAAPGHDLVVVGASAGGVEALKALVAGLPADLAAAVLVVLHVAPTRSTALAGILDRCGPLPARPARDGERPEPGRIYVAVPDRHLLLHDGRIMLGRGPRQNRVRPAVDALFRSAARWRGARTLGVVLSGTLDDGAAGLAAIAVAGGAALVQDPADALSPGMPEAALAVVPTATVAPADGLAAEVARLVADPPGGPTGTGAHHELTAEEELSRGAGGVAPEFLPGRPVSVRCPECSGGMNLVETAGTAHYLCHVGHILSPATLVAALRERVEQGMWTAVSILEELAMVHDQLAERARKGGAGLTVTHQRASAAEVRAAADVIRKHFPEFMRPTA